MITFTILFILVLLVAIITILECGVFLGIGVLLFGDIFVFVLIMHKIFKKKNN